MTGVLLLLAVIAHVGLGVILKQITKHTVSIIVPRGGSISVRYTYTSKKTYTWNSEKTYTWKIPLKTNILNAAIFIDN